MFLNEISMLNFFATVSAQYTQNTHYKPSHFYAFITKQPNDVLSDSE